MSEICPWKQRSDELPPNFEHETLINHGGRTILYFDLNIGGVINLYINFPKNSYTLHLEPLCDYGTYLSVDYIC